MQNQDNKIGRNDSCPCGSGKKYKKCCISKIGQISGSRRTPTNRDSNTRKSDNQVINNWLRQAIEKQKASPSDVLYSFLHTSLRNNADLMLSLLDVLLDKYTPDGPSQQIPDDFQQFMWVLEDTLYELRVLVERQHSWAIEIMSRFQYEVGERVFKARIDSRIQQKIKEAIYDAGITVNQELKDKVNTIDDCDSNFVLNNSDFDNLLKRYGKALKAPFKLVDPFMAQLNVLSVEKQVMSIGAMLASGNTLLSELAIIMLLHPDKEMRMHLVLFLSKLTDFNGISPVSLRRIVGFRNWLPNDERPAMDELIRLISKSHGDCALLHRPINPCSVYSCSFDGAGMQVFLMIYGNPSKQSVHHLLVKQNHGIKDTWANTNVGKRDVKQAIDQARQSTLSLKTDYAYFKRIVSHFIDVGLEQGNVPSSTLLQTAEFGGEYWEPRRISISDEIAALEESSPDTLNPAMISRVLEESGDWPLEQKFASSWFEDDASVENLLNDIAPSYLSPMQLPKLSIKVLEEVVEPKRDIWCERCLLMALWTKASQSQNNALWKAHLINARALHQGMELHEIPLMIGVAMRSIWSAKRRVESIR